MTPLTDKLLTTYSMWSSFRNCRRAAYWRYTRNLVPLESADALNFGKLIHRLLEEWHQAPLPVREPQPANIRVFALIDKLIPAAARKRGSRELADWHLARAIMRGYINRYTVSDGGWTTVLVEHQFEGPIINPTTNAQSRTFYLGGRVDGVVRTSDADSLGIEAGALWLLEHKTAATINADYISKLWTDFQTALYALYIERTTGRRVAGVMYNVLAKAKLKQRAGETEAEYQEKLTEACAKNKSGKSSLKRELPESNADFAARLDTWYESPTAFHREQLILGREQLRLIEEELWELTQAYLDCKRRDAWYMNPDHCFRPGRTCPYFPICSSNDNPNVIENMFNVKAPHEELDEAGHGGGSSSASDPPTIDPDWDPASLSF